MPTGPHRRPGELTLSRYYRDQHDTGAFDYEIGRQAGNQPRRGRRARTPARRWGPSSAARPSRAVARLLGRRGRRGGAVGAHAGRPALRSAAQPAAQRRRRVGRRGRRARRGRRRDHRGRATVQVSSGDRTEWAARRQRHLVAASSSGGRGGPATGVRTDADAGTAPGSKRGCRRQAWRRHSRFAARGAGVAGRGASPVAGRPWPPDDDAADEMPLPPCGPFRSSPRADLHRRAADDRADDPGVRADRAFRRACVVAPPVAPPIEGRASPRARRRADRAARGARGARATAEMARRRARAPAPSRSPSTPSSASAWFPACRPIS